LRPEQLVLENRHGVAFRTVRYVGSVIRQKPYHRENLSARLIKDAVAMLEAEGIEALSN
jgi:hypothetical protein